MAERLNRAVVIARAADLADEIGLRDVTITRLARELGIAAPGVYRHVADADDLHRGIGRAGAREAAAVLASACSGLSGADALAALADGLRRWAAVHPGRYAAVQIAPDPDDAEGRAAAEELVVAMAGALRAYALTGDDLTDAIRMIRSTLHGFVLLELGSGFKDPRDVDASFRRIVAALDTVLRSWA